jgi:hypothetical protein
LLSRHEQDLVPTPERPLKKTQALERFLLAFQLREIDRSTDSARKAHPGASAFPGQAPSGAPVVTRAVQIDTTIPGWQSTGVFAQAGKTISVTVTGDAKPDKIGLRVRIGCHQDSLWHLQEWKRVPDIAGSWAMDRPQTRVTSAFGGLVYIEVPEKAPGLKLTVSIAGVVDAPLFVLGKTTNKEWLSTIRARFAPWAELASNKVIVTVPSSVIRTLDDPESVMKHWDRVLDASADLAGSPRDRKRPERYVADVQISAGYMHSGYPIMTHLDAADTMTTLHQLMGTGKENAWGLYHELGHNHQSGDWTFAGTGEVTCNLFTLYVLETVCGISPQSTGRVLDDGAMRSMLRHMDQGAPFDKWKSDPFLALQMYALVERDFGWDPFKKVFAEYRSLKPEERPKNDDEKRDHWMVRLSRTLGKNLAPYFQAWGVPTSDAARESIKDLPEWKPAERMRPAPK